MPDRAQTNSDALLHRLRDDVDDLKQAAVEHRVRLENGSKVFSDWDNRIKTVEDRTTPKPPSVFKIIGIPLSVVLAGAGALWALANTIRDRPTTEQIEKIIDHHDESGHKAVRDDVRAVQTEQAAQRTLMEGVQSEQKTQGKKLDQLLERTEEPRRGVPRDTRRRRRNP